MEYRMHGDALYEIEIISLARRKGLALELTNMSTEGGVVAEAQVTSTAISVIHQSPMPIEIFSWWAEALVTAAQRQGGPQ